MSPSPSARPSTSRTGQAPDYALIELKAAPNEAAIPPEKLSDTQLLVLRDYVEDWAGNGFRPLPSDHKIYVARSSRSEIDTAEQALFRHGFLRREPSNGDPTVGISPTLDGLKFLWRDSRNVIGLTGRAAIIQPTLTFDAIHPDARLSLLATVQFLAPHGDVSATALSRTLFWPPHATVYWMKKLAAQQLIALNSTATGVLLTQEGLETLKDMQKLRSRSKPRLSADASPALCERSAAVPGVIAQLTKLTGFTLGLSLREINLALEIDPRRPSREKLIDPLVQKGVLLRGKYRLDKNHPELARLPGVTMLYRLAEPLEVHDKPNAVITQLARDIVAGKVETKRMRNSKPPPKS